VVVYTHTHVLLDDIGDGDEVVLDYAVWVECRERYVAVDKIIQLTLLGLLSRS
jgi:hypothetical protein